jgi:hypothetical protein
MVTSVNTDMNVRVTTSLPVSLAQLLLEENREMS